MEIQEEAVVLCKDLTQIMKGKRTKRQRLPIIMPMPSTNSCCSTGVDLATNTATSAELRDSISICTEEEEDMANCLILLAQGHRSNSKPYLYQCKTCGRCFSSFQALGGHRASHKKPKPNNNYEPPASATTTTVLSLQLSNTNDAATTNKSKVHECSICGAEFFSGQALGGHMRRHRTNFVNASATTSSSPESLEEAKMRTRNVFKLDLNLPASEDRDHADSNFPFHSKQKLLVFSASPLVDCHY